MADIRVPVTIPVTIPVTMTSADGWGRGVMYFKYEGTIARDGDGHELGRVSPLVGGGVEVSVEADGGSVTWCISAADIWEAVRGLDHEAARALGPDHWIPKRDKEEVPHA